MKQPGNCKCNDWGDFIDIVETYDTKHEDSLYFIRCPRCLRQTEYFRKKGNALAAWEEMQKDDN